jgi:hypothetical protein
MCYMCKQCNANILFPGIGSSCDALFWQQKFVMLSIRKLESSDSLIHLYHLVSTQRLSDVSSERSFMQNSHEIEPLLVSTGRISYHSHTICCSDVT